MDELEKRVWDAKQNKEKLEMLLQDYTPFIKKQLQAFVGAGMEYDDMLSVSMMVFVNCIYQYESGKGGFLKFAQVSIRNRLIDEGRKVRRNSGIVSLADEMENGEASSEENQAAVQRYEREKERQRLSEEIDELAARLERFGMTMRELAQVSPRQARARQQCLNIAWEIVRDPGMNAGFFDTKRVPQAELAKRFRLSPKTIEKHRKYIVALVIVLTGEYPGIQAFLPKKEVRI